MRFSISQNKKKDLIGIDFYKIDYFRIEAFLNILNVKLVSLFVDLGDRYELYKIIHTNEIAECASKLNESLLMLDGEINECLIDREIETLLNSKILIGIDIGENHTSILINNKNHQIAVDFLNDSIKRQFM